MVLKKGEIFDSFSLKELSDFKKAEKEIDDIIRSKYVPGNSLCIPFNIDISDQLKKEIGRRYKEEGGWEIDLTPFRIILS